MTSRRGIARFRAATGAAGIYWRECTLPHFKCALTCARRTAGSFCFRSLLRASSGCDCGVGASTECVRGQFDTTNVTDLLWCSGTSPPAERPKAIKEAVTSLAGTARSMRFKFPRSTRVLKPGLYAKAGYARPALHNAVPHDHSDQRIDLDARESHSKPRERPKFSSPHFQVIWR